MGQVLEHIRALSATSCRDLPFARSWETHGADLDSIPFLLVACPCGFSDFSDFGLVVLLITSGCPIAHSAAFDRQPVHLSFSNLWLKETEGASFLLFLLFYRNQGFGLPSIPITFLRFACPLYKLQVSPHPPRGVWHADCACFFHSKLWLKGQKGPFFLLFIVTKDFAFISYIFLVRPYFPPRLQLLSFA